MLEREREGERQKRKGRNRDREVERERERERKLDTGIQTQIKLTVQEALWGITPVRGKRKNNQDKAGLSSDHDVDLTEFKTN